MRIGILLFDEVDLMDVAGPYEVFLTASRLQVRQREEPTFDVVTIGAPDVRAFGGLGLRPHVAVDETTGVDLLVVPGAVAIDRVAEDGQLVSTVERLSRDAAVVASVCTGAFLLDRAGLLDGREATTHWEDVGGLRSGDVERVRDDVRWVDDGDIVTSGGLTSGIAMALHLVERFADRELADATARQIDYPWSEIR